MKVKSLGIHTDNILGCDYELQLFNSAKELSDKLKKGYLKKGVKIENHNPDLNPTFERNDEKGTVEKPPVEIYEYQNFFLLEDETGEYTLLDGFRRLLWYNAPNTPILVRVYKKSDVTDKQILTLLVNLNHFKFFGGSSYQDRGFSLLLETVFGIDITSFRDAFDYYLSSDEVKNSYYNRGKESKAKNLTIKDRILTDQFVSDMRFLQDLSKTDHMVNRFLGTKLFLLRKTYSKPFDVKEFVKLAKENTVLGDFLVKYKNVGTNTSSKSQEVVNKILEMYDNVFTLMMGGVVEDSFAEQQQKAKDMVKALKKDKNLTKLTGSQGCYIIERVMEQYIKDGKELKFKCVVHPRDYGFFGNDKAVVIPYGVRDDIKFLRIAPRTLGRSEMEFGLELENGVTGIIWHNYGGWNSYGKKYTKLCFTGVPSTQYDIDLFVEIPQSEIPKR